MCAPGLHMAVVYGVVLKKVKIAYNYAIFPPVWWYTGGIYYVTKNLF